ncbi:glycoside hydrolase family 13 protein [Kushneria aurantia]|uniref:glycoside hydrolase family 13 protein n=1 Tax=Kushneria aurantia TaxID=504092 RepID=UPI000375DD10|nr:glycoside hydrolase family 13 protein [Kushneria aurantia]
MIHPQWWRDAVIYQIYPRSFMDANGDGMGDLAGVTERLDYLAALGVDALWLSPFYRSPQCDAGYDVADYRDVDPLFGTLDDFDRMLAGAHERGMKVIVDLVPNHTSSEHVWFRQALASPSGSPERARYMFREGRGEHGELPPNNWQSIFGGPAWTRIDDGQWYLHMFDTGQPDLDWRNPEVREEFENVLRFWLGRGVDGFRVDVAHGMIKQPDLPDWDGEQVMVEGGNRGPMWDQDEVHDIYRRWHRVLAEYGDDRMMVAEAWLKPERVIRYIRPDEMQQAFNFDYLMAHWKADELRNVIDRSIASSSEVGATTTWVMSNHDGVRHASRLGLSDPGARPQKIGAEDEQPDEALGLRRARAIIMLTLALPGSAYLYQGEELGLPDHTTMPDRYRQDPGFLRTGGEDGGRDGCRVPLPWRADAPAFGFSDGAAAEPWLPQPVSYARYAVDIQQDAPDSTLSLYRRLLALRRDYNLGRGMLVWHVSPRDDVMRVSNGDITVVLNLGSAPVALPEGQVIAHSLPEAAGGRELAGNAAVWLLS